MTIEEAIERLRDAGWRASMNCREYVLRRDEEQYEVDAQALIVMAKRLPVLCLTYDQAAARAITALQRELVAYDDMCRAHQERSSVDRYELRIAIEVLREAMIQ